MHSRGLIHRDLKPLNMVYDADEMFFSLCDLGTAEFYIPGVFQVFASSLASPERRHSQKTTLGTKQYKPPEFILQKRDYDFAVDIWTIGVTMARYLFRPSPPALIFKTPTPIHTPACCFRDILSFMRKRMLTNS